MKKVEGSIKAQGACAEALRLKDAARARAREKEVQRERYRAAEANRRAHALARSISKFAKAGLTDRLDSALRSQKNARERKLSKVALCDALVLGSALKGAAQCADAEATLKGLRALWRAGARLPAADLRECFQCALRGEGAQSVACWLVEIGFDWKSHGQGLAGAALGAGRMAAAQVAVEAGASLDEGALRTALCIRLQYGDGIDFFEWLSERGFNWAQSRGKFVALALERGSYGLAQKLLKEGAPLSPEEELAAVNVVLSSMEGRSTVDWLCARNFDWARRGAGLPARVIERGDSELAKAMMGLGAPMGEPPAGWRSPQNRDNALAVEQQVMLEDLVEKNNMEIRPSPRL